MQHYYSTIVRSWTAQLSAYWWPQLPSHLPRLLYADHLLPPFVRNCRIAMCIRQQLCLLDWQQLPSLQTRRWFGREPVPLLLNVLHFRSNNTEHQPLIEALELIAVYLDEIDPYFPKEEEVPLDDVIQKQWQGWIYQKDKNGQRRIRRVRYELCVLQSLRDKLRCREIWVAGANRYRNPDEDVPADFDEKRDIYYEALTLPTKADDFITAIQTQLREALRMFNDSVPHDPDVEILSKSGGWIRLSPLEKQPDPSNLRKLKNQVKGRWWMTSLLDILKEVDLRVDFTANFPSLTGQERLSPEEKQKRLLLCLFGLGTNTGLTSVSRGNHGISYANLQYVRRRKKHLLKK